MRDVIFRGKRLDNGEWEYGDLLQYDDGAVCIGVHSKNYTDDGFNAGQYRHIVPVDENTVGQYTGLKDKNGKEIYEGDILSDGAFTYEVRYEGTGFVMILDGQVYTMDTRPTKIVIGNIHDNLEMLK